MKKSFRRLSAPAFTTIVAIVAVVAWTTSVLAAPTYSSGYSGNLYYAHSAPDALISYDWDDSGELYYLTSAGFPDTKVWQENGASPINIYTAANHFAGLSLLAIGDYVYFNDSDFSNIQYVYKYGPLSSSPTATPVSSSNNSALHKLGGEVFITGSAGFGTNHIYHTAVGGNGDLDPISDLGETFGGPGPLAFDSVGNLYYAPGYGDLSIYKWNAAQVAAAIANPLTDPLPTAGVLWHDYSSNFPDVSGGTGMAFGEDGDLMLSLTNFSGPSVLVKFDVDALGSYAGSEQVLSSNERIGDVRSHEGGVYVSDGNSIYLVVPEPSSIGLVLVGAGILLRRRRG